VFAGGFELKGAWAKADFPPRAFGFSQEGILAAAAEFANLNAIICPSKLSATLKKVQQDILACPNEQIYDGSVEAVGWKILFCRVLHIIIG
jgi:hypothetical protein